MNFQLLQRLPKPNLDGTNESKCYIVAGGRYVMISGTGDLHIRSARPEDGLAKYSCLTLHSLTQERKRSVAAMLTVTGIYMIVVFM